MLDIVLEVPDDIKTIIEKKQLENIIIETGDKNIYIDKDKKFIVTKMFLSHAIGVFFYQNSLKTIDMRRFDFSEVITMESWFSYCKSLSQIYFPKVVNCYKLKILYNSFTNTRLKSLDFSNWKFKSEAVAFTLVVANSKYLEELILPNVTFSSINSLARDCSSLKTVDFKESSINFTLRDHTYPAGDSLCFSGCVNLSVINCSKMKIEHTTIENIFLGVDCLRDVPEKCLILLP